MAGVRKCCYTTRLYTWRAWLTLSYLKWESGYVLFQGTPHCLLKLCDGVCVQVCAFDVICPYKVAQLYQIYSREGKSEGASLRQRNLVEKTDKTTVNVGKNERSWAENIHANKNMS